MRGPNEAIRARRGLAVAAAAALAGSLGLPAREVAAQAGLMPPIETPEAIAPTLPPGTPAEAAPARPAAGRDAPITFTAEEVEYDRDRALVIARGRVEAWQGERILRADEFTYDRITGVATARGNVQLLEPDGQVLFAESVVLQDQLREGVLEGLRGLLAQDARIAAAGARRTGGNILDLARVVYSACAPCAEDPLAPPLWQLRARVATWDQAEQEVRYRDASLEIAGVPVLYTPYFQHPDPSAPRASGFLTPSVGITRFLGAFVEVPYYWAIDETQDLTLTPTFATRQVPNLGFEYRRRFNFGEFEAAGSVGYLGGEERTEREEGFGWHLFSRGRFAIDENWRAGFDVNRASSELYLRAWRFGARRVLPSIGFAEGFWGTQSYARLDARVYQGLRSVDDTGRIPFVLPNIYYDYVTRTDPLGGTFFFDTWNYAIFRDEGTDTQRLSTRLRYELPAVDGFGSVWTFRAQSDLAAYWYDGLDLEPNFAPGSGDGTTTQANLRAGLDWRLPLLRSAGTWGSQLLEPRVQLVTGPITGSQTRIPNEDSIVFEFTDANLFALNRFPGRDRQEGGTRVDAALRGAWYFPNGGQIEGLVGRSWRLQEDGGPFFPGSGLEERASDYVARAQVSPVPWLAFLGRARLDGETLEGRFYDLSTTVTLGKTAVTGGYLFSPSVPYLTPQREREEVSLGVSQQIGANWRVSAFGRYDINLDRPVLAAVTAGYEDECFILEGRFVKRYGEDPTTTDLYPSDTLFLLRIGFKTLGDVAFRAI